MCQLPAGGAGWLSRSDFGNRKCLFDSDDDLRCFVWFGYKIVHTAIEPVQYLLFVFKISYTEKWYRMFVVFDTKIENFFDDGFIHIDIGDGSCYVVIVKYGGEVVIGGTINRRHTGFLELEIKCGVHQPFVVQE